MLLYLTRPPGGYTVRHGGLVVTFEQRNHRVKMLNTEYYVHVVLFYRRTPSVVRISSDGDDQMRVRIKTQKNPWTKTAPPKKIPCRIFTNLRNFQKGLN